MCPLPHLVRRVVGAVRVLVAADNVRYRVAPEAVVGVADVAPEVGPGHLRRGAVISNASTVTGGGPARRARTGLCGAMNSFMLTVQTVRMPKASWNMPIQALAYQMSNSAPLSPISL